ncbi:hypothetical protein [Undibacterium sp. TC9W]|uniref:hypothetical protein n=1 Tax=Undibacterium sp. TC9W TaxID=3413053 RepID=UPI003BF2F889
MSNSDKVEYARRLNGVLDYVDQHLDTSLELEKLAEVAHFSRFIFTVYLLLEWVKCRELMREYLPASGMQ